MRLAVPMAMLLLGCSSTQLDLEPRHQLYADSHWSFSESCSDEDARVVISPKLFSVGNKVCKIENDEVKLLSKIKLKDCVSDGNNRSEKEIVIYTTFIGTFIDGWTENPQRLYSCND